MYKFVSVVCVDVELIVAEVLYAIEVTVGSTVIDIQYIEVPR